MMDLKKEDNVPPSPAIVQIENLGIKYRIVQLPPGVRSASESASASGIPIERAFKTLLLKSNFDEFLLCSLPCLQQVDPKKLSTVSGLTGLSMAPRADIARITGFECNMVSPFGLSQACLPDRSG